MINKELNHQDKLWKKQFLKHHKRCRYCGEWFPKKVRGNSDAVLNDKRCAIRDNRIYCSQLCQRRHTDRRKPISFIGLAREHSLTNKDIDKIMKLYNKINGK